MTGVFMNIREYVLLSLKELPLIAIIGPFFLGIAEGNINLLMFSLGIAVLAPASAGIIGWLLKWPLGKLLDDSWWKVVASDVSPLLPEAPLRGLGTRDMISVVPTYWMTMTVFFFSYLAFNAISLYTQKPAKGSDAEKVENRKAQAIMALILIGTLGLTIIGAKVNLSGGETVLGVLVAFGIGGYSAKLWFQFLKRCGMNRLEDVFGIQARILPESATKDSPVVCV